MKYLELKEKLKGFPVFSLVEILKIDNNFHRRRLIEWQNKGYIRKVKRGYYIFTDLELNELVLFEIANRIYDPSYISLEIALSYYSLIPEMVYSFTSVSTRKTKNFITPIGNFMYRSIKPVLFFGYNLVKYQHGIYKIASPEKSLTDYFYFNTHIRTKEDFKSLRINPDSFWKYMDEDKLLNCMEKYNQKRLTSTIKSFLEFIKNA